MVLHCKGVCSINEQCASFRLSVGVDFLTCVKQMRHCILSGSEQHFGANRSPFIFAYGCLSAIAHRWLSALYFLGSNIHSLWAGRLQLQSTDIRQVVLTWPMSSLIRPKDFGLYDEYSKKGICCKLSARCVESLETTWCNWRHNQQLINGCQLWLWAQCWQAPVVALVYT